MIWRSTPPESLSVDQVVHSVLRFDRFSLDLTRGCLRIGEKDIELPPKPFEVLCYLATNAGRLVLKQELYEAIWPNVSVTDDSLVQCIRELREKLGDEEHRLIKTMPRRGYLFDVPVSASDVPAVAPSQANTPSAGVELVPPALPLPDRPSVAVLPFTNLSDDREQEYFADGIVDDIITELSRFSELFVIARNSSFRYKGKPIDVRRVAGDLGVRYVLEGSVRRVGDRIRIAAQLIDARTGGHRWAERYDRQLEDVFAVQDEVAQSIVVKLVVHVNKAEIERTINKQPETWQAYDYFLQAAHKVTSFGASWKAAELYEARRLLEQAIAMDPNYARAYARLAQIRITAWLTSLDGDHLRPACLDQAYHLARKAVQLDPNLPEARAVLGFVLVRRREHEAAIAECEKAMALNPNFTDWRLGNTLMLSGHPVRAIEAGERHMRLDPFYAPITAAFLALAHYMLRQYAQALSMLRECASRGPNFPAVHVLLAATHAQLGNIEQARAEAAEVLRIDPKWTINGTQALVTPFKRPEDAEHFFDGLRKAGLPER
jgi:adenylate cyclase